MPETLDVHPATPRERDAAFENVFEFWPNAPTLAEHVALRRGAPHHGWATWYVGCFEGRVVTSLGCHPLRFLLRGREWEGFALAAIHTVPQYRGRGFAPQMIAQVELDRRRQGAALGLLYSDINPDYYRRLGYQPCSAWEGWRDVSTEGNAQSVAEPASAAMPASAQIGENRLTLTLSRFDPHEHLGSMQRLYQADHGQRAISIQRPDPYWENLLSRRPGDQWFWMIDDRRSPPDQRLGYVRLATDEQRMRISELVLAPVPQACDTEEREHACFAALSRLAQSRGVRSLGGWLPEAEVTRSWFSLEPRGKEITMIKPLVDGVTLDDEILAAAGHFQEIDHV
jgi:predicted N-acetyltransferase YhbS